MTIPLNKNLVDLFDMAADDGDKTAETPIPLTDITPETLDNIDKIEQALPQVRGLEASDREMDELAQMAVESYRDLMDLGMQVDSRYSSDILAVSATMLGHALTAKNAKITKKLKMIELQLKKAQLDQKLNKDAEEKDSIPLGEGKALDRNELLKMFAPQKKPE